MNNITVIGRRIVIKDYYNDPARKQRTYNFGLYGELPKGLVRNQYAGLCSKSGNWMNWAYNNPYQPHCDWDFKNKKRKSYIDGSKANATDTLGSMKEIWKQFERDRKFNQEELEIDKINLEKIEDDWWEYYISRYPDNFEAAVLRFENYIERKRSLFTAEEREYERTTAPIWTDDALWKRGCRDYMQYLVRITASGFMMELVLFAALKEVIGGNFIESTIEEEKLGIDGYLEVDGEKYPVCLKPDTFREGVSPLYRERMVFYNKKRYGINDLSFEFRTGEDLLHKGKRKQ